MFTSEFGPNFADVIVIDDNGVFEDANMIITEDSRVFIRQWDDGNEEYQIICMSYRQLNEMVSALNHPAGVYQTLTREPK